MENYILILNEAYNEWYRGKIQEFIKNTPDIHKHPEKWNNFKFDLHQAKIDTSSIVIGVDFGGIIAARRCIVVLVYRSACTFQATHYFANTYIHWLKHLNDPMYMIRHDFNLDGLENDTFCCIEIRDVPHFFIDLFSELIELDVCLLRGLSSEDTE